MIAEPPASVFGHVVAAKYISAQQPTKLWLWPNLLSLDAPIVAVLWQALFARCFQAKFDGLSATSLVLSVWVIYVADRLIDALRQANAQPRHEFHRQHWRAIVPVWVIALAFTAWLAWTRLPPALFARGVTLLGAVAVYFGFTHLFTHFAGRKWPKEFVVAVLFAAGTTVAAWGHVRSLIDFAIIAMFGMLCWINCAAIEQWEERGLAEWPVRAAAIAVGVIALVFLYDQRPILSGAETASAFAFVALDRARAKLSPDALRVLADVALLTPALFLPIAGLRA